MRDRIIFAAIVVLVALALFDEAAPKEPSPLFIDAAQRQGPPPAAPVGRFTPCVRGPQMMPIGPERTV